MQACFRDAGGEFMGLMAGWGSRASCGGIQATSGDDLRPRRVDMRAAIFGPVTTKTRTKKPRPRWANGFPRHLATRSENPAEVGSSARVGLAPSVSPEDCQSSGSSQVGGAIPNRLRDTTPTPRGPRIDSILRSTAVKRKSKRLTK